MANTFKAYSKSGVGTSLTTAYQLELGTGIATKTAIVIGIALSNTHGSPINVDVYIDRPSAGTANSPTEDVYLAKNIPIPSGSTLEVMAGQKLIMEYNSSGDAIKVKSDTASSLDVIVNALEITTST